VQNKVNMSNYKTIDLTGKTFLGQVWTKGKGLPSGIIKKNFTAIGGTTIEIEAERDCIISMPLISIAECKHEKHKNEFGTILVNGGQKDDDILNRYDKLRKQEKHIKFLVTPESLPRLKKLLDGIEGRNSINDYFLLGDEIHQHTSDATYRDYIGAFTSIYFKQPENKRAVLSATLFDFFDERYNKEPITEVVKNDFSKIPILTIETSDPVQTYLDDEQGIFKDINYIFYNSIEGIIRIIEGMHSKDTARAGRINVYCGKDEDNQDKLGDYFCRFGKPYNDLNLFTCAYYTGFDLPGSGHILVIADYKAPHTLPNMQELYQISGRLRGGTKSITLLVNTHSSKLENKKVMKTLTRTVDNVLEMDKVKQALKQEAKKQLERWNELLKLGMINEGNIEECKRIVQSDKPELNFRLIKRKYEKSDVNFEFEIDYEAIGGAYVERLTKAQYSDLLTLVDEIDATGKFNVIGLPKENEIFKPSLNEWFTESEIRKLRNRPHEEKFSLVIDHLKSEQGDNRLYWLKEFEKIRDSYIKLICYILRNTKFNFDRIEKVGYIKHRLKKLEEEVVLEKLFYDKRILLEIQNEFLTGGIYPVKDIKEKLNRVLGKYNKDRIWTASDIKIFYNLTEENKPIRVKEGVKRCSIIGEPKFRITVKD
jgi:hypothetical protein